MDCYRRRFVTVLMLTAAAFSLAAIVWAQGSGANTAQAVTIKREALSLTDPAKYNVPLKTVPIRTQEICSPMDGYIRQVSVASGDRVPDQMELLRIDDSRLKLIAERARAALQASKVEVKMAEAKNDEDLLALAKARLDGAQADVKIAEFDLERVVVRAPFAGELFQVNVSEGQFVRTGQPLLTLADTTNLLVEIPGDRTRLKVKGEVPLTLGQNNVQGKVQALLPPDLRFEPLRNIVPSLTSASVRIENPKGEYFAGQTVYVKLIPREPFAHIPKDAISNRPENNPDGTLRKVQVIRNGVIRDIAVTVLEQTHVGAFVAGPFSTADELIVSSSVPLKDGQQVRLQGSAAPPSLPDFAAQPGAGEQSNPGTPGQATKPASGF